jgi:outer membrane protein assembly factor BamB
LLAAKAADGKEVWKANMRDFGGKPPGWGFCESVLVDEGKVICTPGGKDGTLLALDKATGKKLWQTTDWTDGAQYSSPIIATHNGTRQYIQLTQQHVAGVSAKDGKLLWKSEWGGKTAVIPTPIYKDGFVFIASGYGVGCKLVKLGADGTAANVWENTNMINHHGGVILVEEKLYGYSDKGGWTCQDFKTGDVTWSAKNLGKGAIHCADGMFYCLEEGSGTVALVEVSEKGWNEKGRFKLTPQTEQRNPKGKVWTHPVVSDGKLYLRDQELLFCFDVKGK